MKFRKKPVVIEAVQWFKLGDHPDVTPSRARYPIPTCFQCKHDDREHGWIGTLEGGLTVCPGDWIIRGVKSELYPCKPDIFAETYEPATEV